MTIKLIYKTPPDPDFDSFFEIWAGRKTVIFEVHEGENIADAYLNIDQVVEIIDVLKAWKGET